MGMDVYGNSPSNDKGEYFNNSVFGWHPLWEYCTAVYSRCAQVKEGGGLGDRHSKELSRKLFSEIESGRTEQYRIDRAAHIATLPRHACPNCHGSGTRDDAIGVKQGMPSRVCEATDNNGAPNPRAGAIGWCNGCGGAGTRAYWDSNYSFTVENVREFAEFPQHCGGFNMGRVPPSASAATRHSR